MSAIAAIAVANGRAMRNHLVRTCGGQTRALLVVTAAVAVVTVFELGIYEFYASNFGSVFTRTASGTLLAAQQTLVQSQFISSAALALLLLIFFPAQSPLLIAARVAGASRSALALGGFLPLAAVIALVATLQNSGSISFIAQTQPHPLVVWVSLTLTSGGYAFLALSIYRLGVLLCRAFGADEAVGSLIGVLIGFCALGLQLAELLRSLITGSPGSQARFLQALWADPVLPRTATGLLLTLGATATSVAIATALTSISAAPSTLPRYQRLIALRTVASPRNPLNFILRDIVMTLRHPVGRLAFVALILLGALVVIGVLQALVPAGVAGLVLALLGGAGLESVHGRNRPFDWIWRTSGRARLRRVLYPFLGVLLLNSLVVLTALAVMSIPTGLASFGTLCLLTVPPLLSLSAVAYLAGVALPYSSAAPTSMVMTSVLALGLEAVGLWLVSLVPATAPWWMGASLDLLLATAALSAAVGLVARREAAETRSPTPQARSEVGAAI